ncbi:hypothetical protein EUGRSUZ_F01971 [Eucalyptus grandis]|uniref:Uncharacterized protein n=2 Tax=Eucalyptus grandis TaxID=71139 RepID=A0ACC3KFR9_EUCGR|nr:hypothetical protein EUGRSUZ_F01971 [Eucalyptus grandis]
MATATNQPAHWRMITIDTMRARLPSVCPLSLSSKGCHVLRFEVQIKERNGERMLLFGDRVMKSMFKW